MTGCVRCVVKTQEEGGDVRSMPLPAAVVVYSGKSYCLGCFNEVRGRARDHGMRT